MEYGAMQMENFIREANISRFAELYTTEADQVRRNQLKAFLVEEEDKLGQRSEQLVHVLRRMSESSDRIAELEGIVEQLRSKGRDVVRTEQVLRNMRELHQVYMDHYRVVVDGLNRSSL
jgi:glutaminase